MTIGVLARMLGISTGTLIVWERQGLITPTYRAGGWREYSEKDAAIAKVVKQTKDKKRNRIIYDR